MKDIRSELEGWSLVALFLILALVVGIIVIVLPNLAEDVTNKIVFAEVTCDLGSSARFQVEGGVGSFINTQYPTVSIPRSGSPVAIFIDGQPATARLVNGACVVN